MKYTPRTDHQSLGSAFFSPVEPASFPQHILRWRNDRAAASVGLDGLSDEAWVDHFGRFEPLPDNFSKPLALRYHGHQFRHYNPDIGDGRGFLFAQLEDADGKLLDLGTKGSGRTPYSRTADGRLTLKGAVRELLATELLTARGVNTSQTFSIIETGEALQRHDEPSPTRAAVLVRLNHSHIRFGTFQRLAFENDTDNLARLIDYCLRHYYPNRWLEHQTVGDAATALFDEAVSATASTCAQWMLAGFVHGVLNTDNMNITGESFDYGPWRFMGAFDPNFTAAYFDQQGLYRFSRQPEAVHWNLTQLANCLALVCDGTIALEETLAEFSSRLNDALAVATLRRLNRHGTLADGQALCESLFRFLRESSGVFEQTIVDLQATDLDAHIAHSPQQSIYQGAACTALRHQIDSLSADKVAQTARCDLLIDEVEALWDAIATSNDWQPLMQKVDSIRNPAITRI